MARYRLIFKKSVAKDLRRIPNKEVRRILRRIDGLCVDPRGEGCLKLSDQEKYRVRQGVYRIIYEIRDLELIVQVVKVPNALHVLRRPASPQGVTAGSIFRPQSRANCSTANR